MSASDAILSPPAKRRHTEYIEDEIIEYGSHYLVDGDIVILSLPKDGIVTAFRVDKVVLSRHSPVFRGMLLALPPPTDIEKFDGVPLVRLPDEAEHIVSFISALYDPGSIPPKKLNSDTISKVEGALKLATKYEVDGLRGRIIDHLVANWPQTLAEWDVNQAKIAAITAELDTLNLAPAMLDQFPEPCSVIRLARDCNIPEILPAAFYHLSRIPIYADMDSPLENRVLDHVVSGGRRARFSLLSRTDLSCLLKGIDEISGYMSDLITDDERLVALHKKFGECSRPAAARAECESRIHDAFDTYELTAYRMRDALELLYRVKDTKVEGTCTSCGLMLMRYLKEKREALWDELPRMFGLETA